MADIWADAAALAARRSAKYRKYPPDVLPVWVAEMDVELAEPIRAALVGDGGQLRHRLRPPGRFARGVRRVRHPAVRLVA